MALAIGHHVAIGGNKNGFGKFVERVNAAGLPVMVKGTSDAGPVFEAQESGKKYGVDNVLVYRVTNDPTYKYDTPRYDLAPSEAARLHYNATVLRWPQELDKSLVWMEPINEPRAKLEPNETVPTWGGMHPVAWLGRFMVEYAQIANNSGFKVCGPSFASGDPEWELWRLDGMADWLRYCAENPDKAAPSTHEYSYNLEPFENNYPWLYGRFQAIIAAADVLGIPRTFRIFATEFGWQYDNVPSWGTGVPVLEKYMELHAKFPQLEGIALWTLQDGWSGISDKLTAWATNDHSDQSGDPLASWVIGNQPAPLQQPQQTAPEFGATLPDTPQPPDGGEGELVTKYKYLGAAMFDLITDKVVTDITEPVKETHDRILFHDIDADGKWVFISSTDYIPIPPNAKRVSLGRYHGYEDETENPNPPVSEKFAIGDRVEITANALNVRVVPSLQGTIVTALPKGSRGTVNDGPTLADNVIWWEVAFDADVTGWCSEAWLEYETASKNPLDGLVLGKPFAVPYALTSPFNAPRSYANGLHEGVDYDVLTAVADSQEPILCLYPGTVDISIDSSGGYGKYVRVRHERNGSTFYTRYAHMDERFVSVGQNVDIGDALGEIGTTGNVTGEHVHINLEVPRYGLSDYVVADVVDPHPYIGSSPTPPPTGITYDILEYMVGTHRQQHTLQYTWAGGGTQTIQIMQDGNEWRYVKGGGQYEQLYYDDNWIYRAEDTSESADRFYTQSTNGTLGAAWVKRRMAIGETVYTAKQVQHYLKDGCVPQNGGLVTDALKLTAVYPAYTFDSGIVLKDVIRLEWAAGEGYLFAKGYGLVGFEFSGGKSYISELALQGRDDLPVNVPSCLDLSGRYYV